MGRADGAFVYLEHELQDDDAGGAPELDERGMAEPGRGESKALDRGPFVG